MTRSNCASAYAMRPSSEKVFSLKGSPTLSTPARSSGPIVCELGRSQLGDCRHDRGLARRRLVEALTLRRREDEVQHPALLGRELGLDQVGCLLRLGARDRELVLQAPADGGDEEDEPGDDPDPGDHHAPRMVRAGAHPACQRSGRKSFVCCETILRFRHAHTPSGRYGYDPFALRNSSDGGTWDNACTAETLPTTAEPPFA